MTDGENEIEIEVVDELPSPLEDAEEIVVGRRSDESPGFVPGSVEVPCVECGRDVWLAPSSQQVLRQRDWPVACVTCVLELVEAEADDA